MLLQWFKKQSDIIALILIVTAITLPSIAPLSSGDTLNHNDDFYQYASKHEAVRKAILEYHVFPLRSFWFGGGYPTIGDPEDPTLNPLTLITIIFGSVMGLKIISFLSMLIGGFSTHALARYVLGYTKWGSLFSGLSFGLSLFLPLRILNGNYNEVYSAFLPLCLLLIGLACRGRKVAFLILPFIFYIMLSDGKNNALMSIFYIGILCILNVFHRFDILGKSDFASSRFDFPTGNTKEEIQKNINIKPLKVFIAALIITLLVGMIRFLPAFELIASHGGWGNMDLFHNPQTYIPERIPAYTYQKLLQGAIGGDNAIGLVTIGWLPLLLSFIAFCKYRRQSLPWGIMILLFAWFALAHHAPIDLLKLSWNLPIFNTINKPFKYFSFQIVFTFAIVAGQFFWLLAKMRPKWLEHVFAIVLIVLGVLFLYPRVNYIQNTTYTFNMPAKLLVKQSEFYNIKGKDINRARTEPLNSLAYTNLIRGIGTIDANVAIVIAENAIPKYFIDAKGNTIRNKKYRGEAYFIDTNNQAQVGFRPNSIIIQANIHKPDTLIINQNYHRDWHADHGKLFDQNGLIALKLGEPGSYRITMRYISRSFYVGLLISILSFAIFIFIYWSYKTGKMTKWLHNAPFVVRWIPKSIMWFISR
jgi:hypothetical protein